MPIQLPSAAPLKVAAITSSVRQIIAKPRNHQVLGTGFRLLIDLAVR